MVLDVAEQFVIAPVQIEGALQLQDNEINAWRSHYAALVDGELRFFPSKEYFVEKLSAVSSVSLEDVVAVAVRPGPQPEDTQDPNPGSCEFGHLNLIMRGDKFARLCAPSAESRDNWVTALCQASAAPVVDETEYSPTTHPRPHKVEPLVKDEASIYGRGFHTGWTEPGWDEKSEFYPGSTTASFAHKKEEYTPDAKVLGECCGCEWRRKRAPSTHPWSSRFRLKSRTNSARSLLGMRLTCTRLWWSTWRLSPLRTSWALRCPPTRGVSLNSLTGCPRRS
eukprot:TRINITY_DN20943_c0_g1_i1.p1 TRINITY_DN20943_c0_g1~~TRINITY_DN20943_c0_g1_i1.p1  ORF type:complete len:280 (-),score=41.89 TRINITY_DN20943_c0_g1_i1:650-1489(-)